MNNYEYDLGIIGGGAAGLSVAAGAAKLGVKVLLLNKDESLGGDCLHGGCVPSKTLIATAGARNVIRNADSYGLPSVEIPAVDFSKICKRIADVIGVIEKHDSVERFNSLGVSVHFGAAEFVDQNHVKTDDKIYSAAKWIISTGSSAEIPQIPGLTSTPHVTAQDLFTLKKLPEHLIILGGGPIAIEMAQSFARLGSRVTVIQRSHQILSREDEDMAAIVMRSLAVDGVRFYLDSNIELVRGSGSKVEAIIKQQSNGLDVISGDLLLVAMGRKPNIESLHLEKAGVKFSSSGIIVDEWMRTTSKNIYAAGDVTGKYKFTHAAGYEAAIIVTNAVFKLPKKINYKWMPWCTYSDPELASVGYNEKRAKVDGLKYKVVTEDFSTNDRAITEGRNIGKLKLVLGSRNKPLGVQIAAPMAGELLGEWIAAVNGKVGLATLAEAIHPYPTLVEINKKICGNILGEKLFSPRIREILKFFFSYRGS